MTDAQVEVFVQSVHVGFEGRRFGAAGRLFEDRDVDLQKTAAVEEVADAPPKEGAAFKALADRRVYSQVQIAAAAAGAEPPQV